MFRKFQKILKMLIPLLFGVGIVVFIMQKVDTEMLVAEVRHGINWSWVVLTWALATLSNVLRGVRWRQQLRVVDAGMGLHDLSLSFFGNYAMNLVFPRLGEFWRCNFVAQGTRRPFATIAGTILAERLCDMACMLLFLLPAVLIESRVFVRFVRSQFAGESDEALAVVTSMPAESTSSSSSSWLLWVIAILVVVGIVLVLLRRRGIVQRLVSRLRSVLLEVWQGILALRHLPSPVSYVGWSLAIWLCYFFNTWAQFYMFDFTSHLGVLAALSVFVMGSLSLILPIQGGLGAWQAMVMFALMCYGIDAQHAIIFSVVAWLLEQAFVLVLGLYTFTLVALRKSH